MRVLEAAVLLALLAAPAADARPATLFAHVGGTPGQFALNTQEPDAAFTLDEPLGALANTDTCLPAGQPVGTNDWHVQLGLPTPERVDYGEEGIRVPPQVGLFADIRVLSSPMLLHWYWSEADAAPPVPEVVVRATMQAGDAIHVPDYEPGPLIAAGESAPALLAGAASQGVEVDEVGGRAVYHFVVPMDVDPEAATLSRAVGFTLRVETYVRNEACGDGRLMPNAVRLHSSPGHRPRLELDASGPLRVDATHAQLIAPEGDPAITSLMFNAQLTDAWGHYDVAFLNATVRGPGLDDVPMARAPDLQSHLHMLNPAFLLLAFTIDDQDGRGFLQGNYTFRLSASTLQGANATWEASFMLGEAPEAPAVGSSLLVAALAAVAIVARKRA